MKPESNFKGLRSFLTHLPIDYYILLQGGYKEESTETRVPTNYLYVENIPLLNKRATYFKKSNKVQTVLLEDLYKCSSRFEATEILENSYAIDEMKRHLSERYGEIEEDFFVGYDTDQLLKSAGLIKSDFVESVAMSEELASEMEASID